MTTTKAPTDAKAPPKQRKTAPPPAKRVAPRHGTTWGQAIILSLCVAFLAGVIGWRIGEGSPPGVDSVDVGFSQDMITHHDQAVQMALLVLAKPNLDADLEGYAQEIITDQRYEIGVMTAWLNDWGYAVDADSNHTAMKWMSDGSTPVPASEMPGMQTTAKMTLLQNATGDDAEQLFLEMMISHHEGGIHMAQDAAAHASQQKVRTLATKIVNTQQGDIKDFQNLQQKLGFDVTD